jgi:hypothetical protein
MWVDGFHEGPGALVCLNLLHQLPQGLEISRGQVLHIGQVGRGVVAVRTDVLVNVVGFRLQYTDTPAVEPILTCVATYVEPVKK